MGTAFATGHAAGIAAAVYADRTTALAVGAVQKHLIHQGAYLPTIDSH